MGGRILAGASAMIPWLTPSLLKYGAVALAVATLAGSAYLKGRSDVKAAWNAERAANALVAAKAETANRETEKLWLGHVNKAEVEHAQTLRDTVARAADERQRLRDSAATSRRVSEATGAAGVGAQCPKCAARAELLGLGEAYIGALEAADRERAGLAACAQAWPR